MRPRIAASVRFAIVPVLVMALATGCAPRPDVVRVYDGRVTVEKFVPEEAYAVFLAGTLAEASGKPQEALTHFERIADVDGGDPAIWTRIGELRCRLGARGSSVDEAFGRALDLDPTYAGALAGRARCLLARGAPAKAASWARRAVAEDPTNVAIAAELVRAESWLGASPAARARVVELTIAHGDDPAAWEALASWGRSHGDAELHARGLEGLLRTAPARRSDVEAGARWLVGRGHVPVARSLAGAVLDVPPEREVPGPRDAVVARLAVDDALARGDEERAASRALRGRVPRSELAARALAFDRKAFAERIATELAEADPGAGAARMVLSAIEGRGRGLVPDLHRATDVPPLVCALAAADRLARAEGAEAARVWMAEVRRGPALAGDPLSESWLVSLAARGVVEEAELPLGGRLVLAARRQDGLPITAPAPTPDPSRGSDAATPRLDGLDGLDALDEKHALLWLARTAPTSPRARQLANALSSSTDPIAACARSFVVEPSEARRSIESALREAPTDPLLLARAVELADPSSEGAADLRARLAAVAITPAEKALAAGSPARSKSASPPS